MVSHIKQQTLNEPPAPAMYVPHAHRTDHDASYRGPSGGVPFDAVPEMVRRVVRAADPELPSTT